MASQRVLLSGDYWHADFKDLIGRMAVPATLMQLPQVAKASDSRFSLIIIAQARSGQFEQSVIDTIIANNPGTPVVMLLGSWCEGERRSDQPLLGVKRVYWHQWHGRFNDFRDRMADEGISPWHTPATESDADRIVDAASKTAVPRIFGDGVVVGVSALNKATYETLSEAVEAIDGKPKWVERSTWINLTASVSVVCVDADSLNETLQRRIGWLKNQISHVPMIVLMNFPRREEIAALEALGVAAVVSKPFELGDLKAALESAIANGHAPAKSVRAPAFSKQRTVPKTVK